MKLHIYTFEISLSQRCSFSILLIKQNEVVSASATVFEFLEKEK